MYIGIKGIQKAEDSEALDKLNKAVSMLTANATQRDIKIQTNFEKNIDGNWRYEIPDNVIIPTTISETFFHNVNLILLPFLYEGGGKTFLEYLEGLSKVKKSIWSDFTKEEKEQITYCAEQGVGFGSFVGGGKNTYNLLDFVPYLGKYYNEIGEWKVTIKKLDFGTLGYTDTSNKEIGLSSMLTKFSMEQTIIHEVQHLIQDAENWESGSNLYRANQLDKTIGFAIEKFSVFYNINISDEQLLSFLNVLFCEDWGFANTLRYGARLTLMLNKDKNKVIDIYKGALEYFTDLQKKVADCDLFGVYQRRLGETEARNSSYRDCVGDISRSFLLSFDTTDKPKEEVYTTKHEYAIFGVGENIFKSELNTITNTNTFENMKQVKDYFESKKLSCDILNEIV